MTTQRRTGVIPSLDGIRAIAVLLVIFAHSGLQHTVPGGLGVTIFFVLSGFLITTLMRSEYADTGTIHFRAFYLRRLLRLMPPLLVVVFISGILSTSDLIDGGFTGAGLVSVVFYFGNYFVIGHHFTGIPAGLGVVWSLAVEEHYYLFYPPLALLLFRLGRRRFTVVVLSLLCALVLVWRFVLVAHGASANHMEMATDARVDSILVGCLMAQWRNPWLDPVPAERPLRDIAIAGTCIATLLFTLLYRNPEFRDTLRYTLQSLAIAPLIYLSVARSARRPFRWLNIAAVRRIGVLSYTIYLSHQVIMFGIGRYWPDLGWVGTLLGTVILTWAFAEAMRYWVEMPFAVLRRRLHHGRSAAPNHAESLRPAS